MQMGPQRSSNMPMIIGAVVVGLLLVCCCGGGAAYFFMARSAGSVSAVPPYEGPMPTSAGSGPQVPADPVVAAGDAINVTMTVTAVTGLTAITPGTTCSFVVTHREDSGGLNCQTHVTCGGVTLYGDTATNGFFPCPVFTASPASVSGGDMQTTSADQDPSFMIDTTAGSVAINDDASGHNGAFTVAGTVVAR